MKAIKRRYGLVFWILATCIILFPINNGPLRIATVGILIFALAFAIYGFRKVKPIFYGLIALALAVGIFLLTPGKKFAADQLTESYLRALRSYEGTRYIWGGENKLGIDCSGLVRAGLIKANLQQGVLTLNPALLRRSMSLWWHDCSAKSLGEEYRGFTKRILSSAEINSLDENQILPGDIAVTKSGVHVLAYLGNHQWIEADPDLKRVIIIHTPDKKNAWGDEPVQILRWTQLQPN